MAKTSTRGSDFRERILKDLVPDDLAAEQLLDAAAATLDELQMLERDIAEKGTLVLGARGQVISNPSLAAIVKHRALLARLMDSLFGPADGETPSQKAARAGRARWNR